MPSGVTATSTARRSVDVGCRSTRTTGCARTRSVASLRSPRRIAAPSRLFLLLVVVDTIAGAATPLIYKAIIDQGIEQGRTGLVIGLAGLVAGLAVLSAANGLAQRWFSARDR